MSTAVIKIQVRRGTEAEWQTANPVLLSGEHGFITNIFAFIIGNGVDNYTTLSSDAHNVFPSQFYLESFVGEAINQQSLIRIAAEELLQDNIDAEALARSNDDSILQIAINTEASTRETADNFLQINIDAEVTARENADNTLQLNIDAKQDEITPTSSADYFDGNKTMQPLSGLPVSTAQQTALDLKQNSSLSPLRIKGRWHPPTEIGFALGSSSLTLNTVFALAVRFTEVTTITDIGFISSSGAAGGLANIGIYDSNTNGEPNNLIASASNINCTSSGSKSVTLANPLVLPVGKYWFAIFSNATIIVTSSGIYSLAGIGNATLVATSVTGITRALAFTSLPNPFGAYATTGTANLPWVWFKTA
jgi:hypothetical protein